MDTLPRKQHKPIGMLEREAFIAALQARTGGVLTQTDRKDALIQMTCIPTGPLRQAKRTAVAYLVVRASIIYGRLWFPPMRGSMSMAEICSRVGWAQFSQSEYKKCQSMRVLLGPICKKEKPAAMNFGVGQALNTASTNCWVKIHQHIEAVAPIVPDRRTRMQRKMKKRDQKPLPYCVRRTFGHVYHTNNRISIVQADKALVARAGARTVELAAANERRQLFKRALLPHERGTFEVDKYAEPQDNYSEGSGSGIDEAFKELLANRPKRMAAGTAYGINTTAYGGRTCMPE